MQRERLKYENSSVLVGTHYVEAYWNRGAYYYPSLPQYPFRKQLSTDKRKTTLDIRRRRNGRGETDAHSWIHGRIGGKR